MHARSGPLAELRVVELGGIGPGPFAGMTLADLGADVIRIDRPGVAGDFPGTPRQDLLNRGKRSIALDLKDPNAVADALTLIENADIIIEGFRPGVAERLGLGPDDCWRRNPAVVYGRMTGWGQTGPLASEVGHDISYIAVTGALHAIGPRGGAPAIPLNLVGDYGGGGLYLVVGLLAAIHSAKATGRGQVVDAAIVDGAAHLLTGTHAMLATGTWEDERGQNVLDGGAPFYNVYETSDGKHMAVGAIENNFYAELLSILGVEVPLAKQWRKSAWPELRERIAHLFLQRTQDEWTQTFAGTNACVAPVASLRDAADHPHLAARGTLVERDGILQAAPAPRFSATPAALRLPPPHPGEHQNEIIAEFGLTTSSDSKEN